MTKYLVDGTPEDKWEDCIKPGCSNKRCARLSPSPFCYPHSNDPASRIFKQIEGMLEVSSEEHVKVRH